MDLAALPPTIDFAGPNGSAFYRTTQLSYMYNGLKNWKFGIAAEMPSVDGTNHRQTVYQHTTYAGFCHICSIQLE